jgi:hypothetical protein
LKNRRDHLRNGDQYDQEGGQKGRATAHDVKDPADKDGEVNENETGVGQQLDLENGHGHGRTDVEPISIPNAPVHADRPIEQGKDEHDVEVMLNDLSEIKLMI